MNKMRTYKDRLHEYKDTEELDFSYLSKPDGPDL